MSTTSNVSAESSTEDRTTTSSPTSTTLSTTTIPPSTTTKMGKFYRLENNKRKRLLYCNEGEVNITMGFSVNCAIT